MNDALEPQDDAATPLTEEEKDDLIPTWIALHSEGPEALFAGRENLVDGLFGTLKQFQPRVPELAVSQADG